MVDEESLNEIYKNTSGENSHVTETSIGNDVSICDRGGVAMMSPAHLPKINKNRA